VPFATIGFANVVNGTVSKSAAPPPMEVSGKLKTGLLADENAEVVVWYNPIAAQFTVSIGVTLDKLLKGMFPLIIYWPGNSVNVNNIRLDAVASFV
jgi:hypothetical protein